MIKIDKNRLPNMREDGSVKNTEKYTIAEYEPRGLRLEDLANRIASQLDIHFILYDYKGNISTDNEDVIQILKDEYPSGDYPAYGTPSDGFAYDNMSIDFDQLLQLKENKKYEWVRYHHIPKWYYIYRKLARLLSQHDILGNEPPGKLLYEKCFNNQTFRTNNEWIEKFDSEWGVQSLDPIQIFASFNNNKLTYQKRVTRINILFNILDKRFKDNYKDINFDGCPAPMTIHMIAARDENTQKQVWDTFYEVMDKSQDSKIEFSKIQKWYGINIGSFTIFLFWIDAKNFLPLDKNTEALLETHEKLDKFPTTYQEYKNLLIFKNTHLYLFLSLISYDINDNRKLREQDRYKLGIYLFGDMPPIFSDDITIESDILRLKNDDYKTLTSEIEESNNFKLISIKPLEGCNKKYLKTLKEDELYLFDKAYKIKDDVITIDSKKNLSLFDLINEDNAGDLGNTKLNINAIVGKNGTGKSTIVELLFVIIYNVSVIKKINTNINKIEDVNVEFIFQSLHIYKIRINNGIVEIYQYKKIDNKYVLDRKPITDNFNIDKLFYNIVINYSQHSLNNLNMGNWIYELFHKNDAYQTPIVIEPYRDNGNININRQEELIKQRLLSNLLEQKEEGINKKDNPRQLTEFYSAVSLELVFNVNKIFYRTENIQEIFAKDIYKDKKKNISIQFRRFKSTYKTILKLLYKKFDFYPEIDIDFKGKYVNYSIEDKIHLYVLKKLVTISNRYANYYKYFNFKDEKFVNLNKYIEALYNDTSHITYKLKQAINFLRFNQLIEITSESQTLSIEKLSNQIEKIKLENREKELTTIELIPPSFFDINIILDENIQFNTLSSGEKQKIYSMNSILYHINNINSVNTQLVKYKYINIILDEIELYFHPELQRNYLTDLRHTISKAQIDNILGINILFVTHSPFILSDIPDTKILFLEKDSNDLKAKTIASQKEIKTFGANIHELLINGFFMNSSMGEFSLSKIKNIVDFHYKVINNEDQDINKLKNYYKKVKNEFYFLQEHIGEDYISGVIKNHIIDIEKRLNDNSFKNKRIELLKKELEILEREMNDKN